MNANTLSAIVASVALAILILGFLIGWVRGYQKSLLRLILVLICAVAAYFLTPLITDAVIAFDLTKYNIVVGGKTAKDVGDLIILFITQISQVNTLVEASPTFEVLVTALPSMIVNVVLFIVVYLLLKLITMIVYWIFAGIFLNKKKLEGKSKVKLVGATLGTASALVTLAVILVPVFGFINIANNISAEYANNAGAEEVSYSGEMPSASLVSEGVVTANETNTSDATIKTTVGQVANYTEGFNDVWIVKIFNSLGVKNLSVEVFNKLSTKTIDGEETNLTIELGAISKMLPYVDSMLGKDIKLDDNLVLNINGLLENAYDSKLIGNILDEVVVAAADEWNQGKSFMGIAPLTVSDNSTINAALTKVYANLANIDVSGDGTIKRDLQTIVNMLNTITTSHVEWGNKSLADMFSMGTDDLINALANKDIAVFEEILNVAYGTEVVQKVVPEILDIALDFIYDALNVTIPVGEEASYKVNINTSLWTKEKWETESGKIQDILGSIAGLYSSYTNKTASQTIIEVLNFEEMGAALDAMRDSAYLSNPSAKIFNAVLDNEMIGDTIPADTKTTLKNSFAIAKGQPGYINLKTTFKSLNEMVTLAKKMKSETETLTTTDIVNVLDTLTNSEAATEVIKEVLTTDNLQAAGLDAQTSQVVVDVVNQVTSQITDENKQEELAGIAAAVDIVSQTLTATTQNPVALEEAKVTETVAALENSTIVKDMLDNSGSGLNNIDISDKINEATKTEFTEQINASTTFTAAQKAALLALLTGTTNP